MACHVLPLVHLCYYVFNMVPKFILQVEFCCSYLDFFLLFSEEDGSQLYLVDFQQKAIVTIADKRKKRLDEGPDGKRAEEEEEDEDMERKSFLADDDSSHRASHPDEEW